MGCFKRQERGFTMLELLIVIAILVVVVAAVVVSLVGFKGRGSESSYSLDGSTLQTVVSAFYSTKHSYHPVNGWNEPGSSADFHFPTRNGRSSSLYSGDAVNVNGQMVYLLMNADTDSLANADDVIKAAIWMGLLVNGPGSGTGIAPVADTKDNSAPLAGENGPYLNEVPKSCSTYNSLLGKGTYTWIVGKDGRVHGVFVKDCIWYQGYNGAYP
jgi:prepilin-type N-terminal cleavage/methylation domain-containing protein